MSVRIRRYRRGGWEVDIRVVLPDNSEHRERRKAPVESKSAGQRWGETRERVWYEELTHPKTHEELRKEVPTLAAFWPRFLDGYVRANRHKTSGISSKQTIGRVDPLPSTGSPQSH